MSKRTTALERRRSQAYPLDLLPAEMQERIRAQVAADTPPPKWIGLGVRGDTAPLAMIRSRGWYEWHWQRGIDPDARRPTIAPSVRAFVIQRDGYVCQLCGGDVEQFDVHLDHILPYSKGGETVSGNLQVAHSRCNIRKGARV